MRALFALRNFLLENIDEALKFESARRRRNSVAFKKYEIQGGSMRTKRLEREAFETKVGQVRNVFFKARGILDKVGHVNYRLSPTYVPSPLNVPG